MIITQLVCIVVPGGCEHDISSRQTIYCTLHITVLHILLHFSINGSDGGSGGDASQ